jgi:hypothetical protein
VARVLAGVFVLLLTACAAGSGAGPDAPPREIVIPSGTADSVAEAPPGRGDPVETVERADPYRYFVGVWDGVVNDKLTTRLEVSEDGRFRIHLPAHQHRPMCDLWGRLRVSERVVWFDIEHSNCAAENAGSTLERQIVTKTEDELVVRATDGRMLVRYTRRRQR